MEDENRELVEKARKFVAEMDRESRSIGPTRAATWILEYATGDTRMDIYDLMVAFAERMRRWYPESSNGTNLHIAFCLRTGLACNVNPALICGCDNCVQFRKQMSIPEITTSQVAL